ncbi:four helix bundle protein [Tenacibaculum tangerinum]|uniref:Four helix bundle protein n=1 Tax=Tenacibaculum tangerinum TaxID=3038772 RepID=A0ABY8L761_9FLAO|nr:four helix bundle protein [Tenacibaculum tangerinum]WGH77104.1 four helix bundle protein [Tenacibaculum tangerinum]
MALGSCYEIETQLLLSYDLGFTSKKDLDETIEILKSIIKMMSKFNTRLSQ